MGYLHLRCRFPWRGRLIHGGTLSIDEVEQFPSVPANPLSNPNRLRISVDDFELRLLSLHISTPEEQQQQQQQHPANTRTADVLNRAMEASMEEVVVHQQQQQQHHVKKEHTPKGVIDGVIKVYSSL